MEDKQLIINLQNENKRLKELLKKNNIVFEDNEEVIEEKTFLFDLICNDLIEEITKYNKWFKAIDRKNKNIICIHRVNFINEPSLDYNITFFYKDYENNKLDYWSRSSSNEKERFDEKRSRKYKKNKNGLLNYNFTYRQFNEIKC